MKVVILSDCSVRDRYFLNLLSSSGQPFDLVRLVYTKPDQNSERLSALKKLQNLADRFLSLLLKKTIGGTNELICLENLQTFEGLELNSEVGAKWIGSLAPDVLVTCGAPLLKQEILNIPQICALNIHFGLAPYYRGNDSLYWTLFQKDYQLIGATIHKISAGIDSGDMLARVYPALSKGLSLVEIEQETTRLLAEVTTELLKKIQPGFELKGRKQQERGRLYRSEDRTISHLLRNLLLALFKNKKLPQRDQRVEIYVPGMDQSGTTELQRSLL